MESQAIGRIYDTLTLEIQRLDLDLSSKYSSRIESAKQYRYMAFRTCISKNQSSEALPQCFKKYEYQELRPKLQSQKFRLYKCIHEAFERNIAANKLATPQYSDVVKLLDKNRPDLNKCIDNFRKQVDEEMSRKLQLLEKIVQ